jgi:hypothetical protein
MTASAPSLVSEVLDYERLFADYTTGLVDRLRGFGPAAECLALWVPDEDPSTSLRNLWDAAAAAGEQEIAVWIGPATASVLDEDDVLATAARFGVATLTHGRAGWLVEVQELRAAAPVAIERTSVARPRAAVGPVVSAPATREGEAHSIYGAAIERSARSPLHEGDVAETAGLERVAVEQQGVALVLSVDPATHCIRQAAFRNAATGHRGLMERFCALLEGVPLLDAADHGVQRLEFALRAHWSQRPVAGIVTPRAADPCFELPLALIRRALADYRARTGFAARTSTHDPGPSAAWKSMGGPAQRAAIRAVLERFSADRGGAPDDVELLAIEFDVRLVLRVDEHMTAASGPGVVLDIERALRDAIDPRLEVVLEEIRDRNRKRRLALSIVE